MENKIERFVLAISSDKFLMDCIESISHGNENAIFVFDGVIPPLVCLSMFRLVALANLSFHVGVFSERPAIFVKL